MSPKDESDRDAILARRRLFVASALASIAVTQTQCDSPFRPCLSPAIRADADPAPCLSPPLSDRDASAPPVSADAGDAGAEAEPKPCLSVALPPDAGRDASARPPQPNPCLSPMRPQPCLKPAGGGEQF